MAFNFLQQELAIDLGTANTIIFENGKIVLDQPSIVALDTKTGKLIAVGDKAQLMDEKTNPGITCVRPLRDGVIADFNAAELMIGGFIKLVNEKRHSIFSPNLKLVVGVSMGSTPVEIRAVRDSCEHAGARDLFLIYEPMASALGVGLNVEAPMGSMIVDIGGGTTEIAVISLGGVVAYDSVRTAGNEITRDIQNYMERQYNFKCGFKTAERIKFAIGSVLRELPEDEEPDPITVHGRNIMTASPIEAEINYHEVAHCIDNTIVKLENSIIHVLEQTPPELYSDIVDQGIWLAGGGSLLRGIARRFTDKINIQFHVAEDPLKAVARGTCAALGNTDNYSFLMR